VLVFSIFGAGLHGLAADFGHSSMDRPDRNTDEDRRILRVANIKSQKKRILTNERNRLRNQSVKSSLRTIIRSFRAAEAEGDKDKASAILVSAGRQLDKAASKGVIHKNQAANKKSALALAVNKL
jgi:small subunit ribosomal protein S20